MGSLLSYIYKQQPKKTFLEKHLIDDKWNISLPNENEIVLILKKYVASDVVGIIIKMMCDYEVVKVPIKGQIIEILRSPLPEDLILSRVYGELTTYDRRSSHYYFSCPICGNRFDASPEQMFLW